ncbi:MAG: hypothetical protein LWX52_16055 [Deltaproteobacteria bacterium]|jgi:hypothetical protein|nr:hypothetical protein [Deltaproteobacteria bacterium]
MTVRNLSFVLASFLIATTCAETSAEPLNDDQIKEEEVVLNDDQIKEEEVVLNDDQIKRIMNETLTKQSTRKFAGLDFGVGVSLTYDTGKHDRVKTAEIIDGVVRVSKDNNANARIMLESHYFFTPDKYFGLIETGNKDTEDKTFGFGPFIALQPGTDEIIEAIGLGIMVGWKRKGPSSGSWNCGVGLVVDPKVQILGDGFEANQPPPGSETVVRFKETDQWGVVLLASFTF